MKFATKPIRHYSPHLRHVATLPWKIEKSNFSRYSADMDENANKVHFNPVPHEYRTAFPKKIKTLNIVIQSSKEHTCIIFNF